MAKIKLAVVCPIPSDPTSFYRGIGPLSHLAKHNENVQLLFPQAIDWSTLSLADILFIQRPCDPQHFAMLCMAKDMGLKIWVDMDDDNLAVPKDNPTYQQYNQLHIKEAIVKLARHCDVLSVSTQHLKRKFGIYNKNTVLIPNALNEDLLHLRQIPPGARAKKILWRGTPSHQRNLMTVGKELVSLSRKHEDYKFTFFGCDPIDLTDQIKNNEVLGNCSITDYFKVMSQLHATCLYYPLASNDHAQARSHISWLEGTFAGCVVLASKNDEFTRPGLLNFTTPGEFETLVDQVCAGAVNIDECVETSWAEIQEKYLLKHTNKLRESVIETLLS